jgi:hypothetical protein
VLEIWRPEKKLKTGFVEQGRNALTVYNGSYNNKTGDIYDLGARNNRPTGAIFSNNSQARDKFENYKKGVLTP